MSDELIVIHEDIAMLRYCSKGSRAFFIRHNLDWPLFLRQGIEASTLIALGDEMGLAAVEQAKRRVAGEVV